MIVTDRFVFVHMHKTGGQTINRLITECIADHSVVGYHYPIAELPDEASHLPIVGIVRNPWDWYVSWYAFNRRAGIRNPLYHVVAEGGTADFRTTVTGLVELGSDTPRSRAHRQRLLELLPDTLDGNRGAGLTRSCMPELAASGRGYLTWLFERMLGGDHAGGLHVGRFENLQDDFLAILGALDVPEAGAIGARFERSGRRNVSRHSHYSHYYDDALRDLVAERERTLIERYGYHFEARKPAGAAYDFPPAASADSRQDFRKLLGRGRSFLRLNDRIDVDALRRKVGQLPAERWAESDRNRIFKVHSHTQSLALVHFEDYKYETPEYRDLYAEFRDEIGPIVDYVADYYQDNGFVVRALLAKLAAGGEIPRHTDAGYSLMNCHRVHLPIITNGGVEFFVGGESVHMRAGELWEINNATMHGVENRGGDDRVHLIIDWMPNYRGEPVAQVLSADDLEGDERAAANEQMLATMIRQAQQLQRSGQAARAEALYRQVLHFDPGHVVAGNLLGLMCLQTRRFDEAVQHIERALASAPEDAQAHANLGLALKECGRPDDAVRHMQESLRLAPDNPRVLSNLGSLLVMLGRTEDAVHRFRQALALQPAYAEVHFNLGSALLRLERYDEAAASLQQCVTLRPDFAEGRHRLGKAQELLRAARTSH
jgi:tetratricopeptide (TPR) repeat protein